MKMFTDLASEYLEGKITASEFVDQYLHLWRKYGRTYPVGSSEGPLVDKLFSDVESFVSDDEMRELGIEDRAEFFYIDEQELREGVKAFLIEARNLDE